MTSAEADISLFARKRKRRRLPVAEEPALNGQHCAALAQPCDERPAEATPAAGESEDDGTSFKDLGVSEWLCRVCKSLGMLRPTTVQRGCIPAILGGRDVMGTAHTGSGKTAAFALPILQLLARDPFGVFALVLTPTRELAFQLADQFRALGAGMALMDAVVVGGLEMQAQARALAARPHVVVATPGRLRGLLAADASLAAGFARARFLVLDEADRLLDASFEGELRAIGQALPARRQTLLFSATLTRSLAALQAAALRDAFHFRAYEGLQTAAGLREEYVLLPARVREVYLAHLLEGLAARGVRSAIVFAATCRGCHLLGLLLQELGVPAAALHSHQPQRRRLAALDRFKSGGVPVLLATDVASRGLDIPAVDLVVNFELPALPADYVHRVGRTARAGRPGWALSFITQYDVDLVHGIEEVVGHQLAESSALEEAAVLKSITRVFAAKRAAALRAAEEATLDTRGGAARLQKQKKARLRAA